MSQKAVDGASATLELLRDVTQPSAAGALRPARMVGIDGDGRALIELDAEFGTLVAARTAAPDLGAEWARRVSGALPVLVTRIDGDPTPVIVAVVKDRVAPAAAPVPKTLRLDAEALLLEGQESVEIRCGEAAILLRRDGRVTVRGTDVVSRARGTNKLRGANVKIN